MGKDPPSRASKGHGSGNRSTTGATGHRRERISKAMSWLLRHGAHKENVAMDDQGYVRLADLMAWLGKKKGDLNATLEEVLDEIRSNPKQRFALLYVPSPSGTGLTNRGGDVMATRERGDVAMANDSDQIHEEKVTGEAAVETATATALKIAASSQNPDPSHFSIRATQGHSITTISASAYISPITLNDPSSIPSTVVHGTFYAAWSAILKTGGLKPMSRIHVHFATGPSLESALSPKGSPHNSQIVDGEKAVISGMRSDAQLLIYIDIAKALELGVPFGISENQVVLSEGLPTPGDDRKRIVPMSCWDQVVEVSQGLGVIWRDGKQVQELPEHLRKMGWPKSKAKRANEGGGNSEGQGRGQKRKGGKPNVNIERDILG